METQADLARSILGCERAIEAHQKEVKYFQDKKLEIEIQLRDELLSEGVANTGEISGVGMLSITRSHYPSINAGDLPAFIDGLRDTEDFSIVKEMIPPRNLKTFLKKKVSETYKQFKDENYRESIFPNQNFSADEANQHFWRLQNVRIFSEVGIKWTKREVSPI